MNGVNQIICGPALEVSKTIPDESINCSISSPPYWALRDYGVDGQLGLEKTFEKYIDKLCAIYDEVKRVLRKDGTCWVNLGDTYNAGRSGGWAGGKHGMSKPENAPNQSGVNARNIPTKSLCLIPQRFAIEMVNRGWILRNTIIWHKPNPMPSSAKDRFTVDFEYVYFFVKSKNYFFEPIYEPHSRDWTNCGGSFWHPVSTAEHGKSGYAHSGPPPVPNPLGRNKRCVWKIPTQAYKFAHFACVDPETEILTIEGWKRYTDIQKYKHGYKHIQVATYSKMRGVHYEKLSHIKEYDYEGELVKVGNRDLDILMTPNHRCVIQKRAGFEDIVRADSLCDGDKIKVLAHASYKVEYSIGQIWAALTGWVISEGHYKKGGYVEIYQNKGKNEWSIDLLLKDIPHTKHFNRGSVVWYLSKCPFVDWMYRYAKGKRLNRLLVSLPLHELSYLFYALISGDGHTRKDDGRLVFIQKDKETVDWFEILAMRLGYHTTTTKRKSGTYSVHLTTKTEIGIRKTNGKGTSVSLVPYKGKVWCPSTPSGTWVAKRNGRIFITGNTFPEKLVEPMILAGCPKEVCSKCGQGRRKVYEVSGGTIGKDWNQNKRGIKHGEDLTKGTDTDRKMGDGTYKRAFKGYTDCGCGEKFRPGVVFDPFVGRARLARSLPKTDETGSVSSLNRSISRWPNAA